jgi:hypothetical protein
MYLAHVDEQMSFKSKMVAKNHAFQLTKFRYNFRNAKKI